VSNLFIKYINTYFKRIASYVIAAILILTSILPSLILYINTVSNNKAIAETKKATGYIVFDLLDEIINISADMVEGNKEFFLNNNNSEIEYIKISNEIRNIKNSCPYVERIVFYKKNDHRLLTDNGTIGKKDFFGKEYKNEKYNEEFWYNLLDTFQTPSIIPAVMYNSESGLDGHASRMFVVPNIYYIYNVGVLFFINEEKFIEYCGFNTNKECKIAFYNLNGDYIFGNTDKQLSILKVPEGSSTEELNLLGNYKMTSWFKYNDMVFQINIKNGSP